MYKGWHLFWLIWFSVAFLTFIIPEIYALCTDVKRTLSASIWNFEKIRTDQPINQWTAAHFLFGGALIIIFIWLIGHFIFYIWR